MAEQTSAQMRLDKLVAVIAANMVAEVCSIYLRRAGKVLELFATEGLNRAAVHQYAAEGRRRPGRPGGRNRRSRQSVAMRRSTRISPTARKRAKTRSTRSWACPSCAAARSSACSRCRTGPSGIYDEEEVEALQTVAMVLAEVVAQGGFFDIAELDEPELRIDRPRKFKGEGLSEGVAVGRVVLHEPRVKVDRMIADNPAEELNRLEDGARRACARAVDQMLDSSRTRSDRREPRSDRGLSAVCL